MIVDLLRTLDEQLGFLRPCALVGDGLLATTEYQVASFNAYRGASLLIFFMSLGRNFPQLC